MGSAGQLIGSQVIITGPIGSVWYLGERAQRQWDASGMKRVPHDPPLSMLHLNRAREEVLLAGSQPSPAHLYMSEGDYATVLAQLMPPLVCIVTLGCNALLFTLAANSYHTCASRRLEIC